MGLYYYKDIFTVKNMEEAKNIILTKEETGGGTNERWDRETKYMLKLFRDSFGDLTGKTVLDFGCGIGRLSKALIENYDCFVLGVDISASMRRLAQEYVASERFSVISYEMFSELAGKDKLKVDLGMAVYVLQHVYDPQGDIKLLSQTVKEKMLVLNTFHRAIPVIDTENRNVNFLLFEGGETDDVAGLMEKYFQIEKDLPLDGKEISVADRHWCRVYRAMRH